MQSSCEQGANGRKAHESKRRPSVEQVSMDTVKHLLTTKILGPYLCRGHERIEVFVRDVRTVPGHESPPWCLAQCLFRRRPHREPRMYALS